MNDTNYNFRSSKTQRLSCFCTVFSPVKKVIPGSHDIFPSVPTFCGLPGLSLSNDRNTSIGLSQVCFYSFFVSETT